MRGAGQANGVDVQLLEEIRESAVNTDGPSLATLLPLVASQFHEVVDQQDEYRFVYFNEVNRAMRPEPPRWR